MGAAERLLIIERVLPSHDVPSSMALGDITMLLVPGGRERTEAEYSSLLEASGLALNRMVPTRSEMSVTEAVPAGGC